MSIRAATLDDRPCVRRMVGMFLDETPYPSVFGDSTAGMDATIDWLITSDDGDILVDERAMGIPGCALTGLLAVTVFRHLITGEPTASELMWWVHPKLRATRIGLRLFRGAEKWATERGAVTLQMGSWNPKLESFYARLGYVPTEVTYTKRVEGA